jgi:hypothetical protein
MPTIPPNWSDYSKHHFNDNKFVLKKVWAKEHPVDFPGYIENADHPFTYCNSLTHLVKGKPSDNWSGTDSPELYLNNLKTAPLDWRYRSKKITYKVNSSGYRTREWKDINWKESIVILGCSNTFGIGLDEDETISYMLESKINRPVINLGYPSGSNELILNNSVALFENFGAPYGVVINWSTPDRMRYFFKDGYLDLGPWNHDTYDSFQDGVDIDKLYKLSTLDENNVISKNYYISRTANSIWSGRTKYVTFSYFGISAHYSRADEFFTIDNGARDMLHPGHKNSEEVANFLYEKLK